MTTERLNYGSLDDHADAARSNAAEHNHVARSEGLRFFGDVTFEQALAMLRDGYPEGLADAMPLVESALELVDHDDVRVTTFEAIYDVAGSAVDVGRYCSGVPECMVEYEPVTISKAGRVVTLCVSVAISASVSPAGITKRGAAIVALCMALERTGHAVELWADWSAERNGHRVEIRTLVKGPHDVIDPERIAFLFTHAASLRHTFFAAALNVSEEGKRKVINLSSGYGTPADPTEDLPKGTIYLPCLLTPHDVPDPERFVLDRLRELGLTRD